MSRQIEPEMIEWMKRRAAAQAALTTGIASGDFAAVDPAPYREAEPGQHGFPVTVQLEDKLVSNYTGAAAQPIDVDEGSGLVLQLNTLEAFRRANLAERQGRAAMLAHLEHALSHAPRYNNLFAQVVVNTAKVLPRSGGGGQAA